MKVGDPVNQQAHPPIKYRSPDRLHNCAPGLACDMWSYMCIFAQLYLGLVPLSNWHQGGIVTSMVDLSGPLPMEWKDHYVHPEDTLDSWYDPNYKPHPDATLAAKVTRLRPEINEIERRHALSVMSRGFSCHPERRPTASQLLRDPCFKYIIEKYCH
jgi:serine/threonine protein kinase